MQFKNNEKRVLYRASSSVLYIYIYIYIPIRSGDLCHTLAIFTSLGAALSEGFVVKALLSNWKTAYGKRGKLLMGNVQITLMQGLDILNLARHTLEVLLHLRRLPLLLAILATDPPKSSSLYVHTNLGRLLLDVMCRNRWSFGLILKALSSAGFKKSCRET